ncbi:MAG: hypothetical protein K1X36_09590, partial [Pyrinomonadaceae bacterium]|nr:hypothetical protein [Pyrinomonadaceae bacterium]
MTAPTPEEIHGSFLTNPFAELAAEIVHAELTGSLRISSSGKKYIVYFTKGVVRFAVSNARSARLFDILLRQKRLTVDDLKEIPNFAIDHELVGFLESTGFLNADSKRQLYVEQIQGILIDLLSQPSGDWSFTHLARLRDGLSFEIDTGRIMSDYAHCLPIDTVLSRFRSLDETFSVDRREFEGAELTSDEVQVMGCLSDDPATAASIIDRSGLSEVAAIKALYALWL